MKLYIHEKLCLWALIGAFSISITTDIYGMDLSDIRDIYIIPMSFEDASKDVAKREWKVLLGREKGCLTCIAESPWHILHISFKNLFMFGRLRSFIGGKFKFDQNNINEYGYIALRKLTNGKLTRESALYHTYATARGGKIANLEVVQPESNKRALYFLIPTEYVSASALNPGKVESDMTLQWLDPEQLNQNREDVEDNTTKFFDLDWSKPAKKVFKELEDLEEKNTAAVIASISRRAGSKYRWDQLNNIVYVGGVDYPELSLTTGRFSLKDKSYKTPRQYYDESSCKGSAQEMFDCQIKNLFIANFLKFKNERNKAALTELKSEPLKNKVLVYRDADHIIGVGTDYRGLNCQGRMLMFLRDTNLDQTQFSDDQKGAEAAYEAYKKDNRYVIHTLVKSNLSFFLKRWAIAITTGDIIRKRQK